MNLGGSKSSTELIFVDACVEQLPLMCPFLQYKDYSVEDFSLLGFPYTYSMSYDKETLCLGGHFGPEKKYLAPPQKIPQFAADTLPAPRPLSLLETPILRFSITKIDPSPLPAPPNHDSDCHDAPRPEAADTTRTLDVTQQEAFVMQGPSLEEERPLAASIHHLK